MRRILARYRGADPTLLRFRTNAWGKPSLEAGERGDGGGDGAPGPWFSLSHSGEWAALAACWEVPVGLDVEVSRPVEPGIARSFAAGERAVLADLAPAERGAALLRAWTRKEAVLKALGRGLSLPLSSVEVTLGPADRAPRLLRLDLGADTGTEADAGTGGAGTGSAGTGAGTAADVGAPDLWSLSDVSAILADLRRAGGPVRVDPAGADPTGLIGALAVPRPVHRVVPRDAGRPPPPAALGREA